MALPCLDGKLAFQPISMPFPYGGGWLDINVEHADRLRPGEWVSGIVIDLLGVMLQYEHGRDRNKWLYSGSYFWEYAKKDILRRENAYTFGLGIFDFTYVLVPINTESHWSLIVIERIPRPDDPIPMNCVLWHADSYGTHAGVDAPLRRYLRNEVIR
ncbi:unnamed protein product [Closterium sp. NIES-53]